MLRKYQLEGTMTTFVQSFIVALFILAMSMPAEAITGNKLLEDCEKSEDQSLPARFQHGAFCAGYVTGVTDGLFHLDYENRFCLPKGVTHGQTQKVVVKYLRENPQRLHEHYVPIILSALKEAFPCKETEPSVK